MGPQYEALINSNVSGLKYMCKCCGLCRPHQNLPRVGMVLYLVFILYMFYLIHIFLHLLNFYIGVKNICAPFGKLIISIISH